MRSRPLSSILLAAALLAPRAGSAQFETVSKLFDKVHSVAVSGQTGRLTNSYMTEDGRCAFFSNALCGAGVEVLIDVGDSAGEHWELGLGAGYLSGFGRMRDSLDFRASMRTFPTVSAYYTNISLGPVGMYLGGNMGLVELVNAQAYGDSALEYGVKGNTFELGATVGLYGEIGRGAIFIEPAYRWRRFSSLDYTFASAVGKLPRAFPRELDLSALQVSVGFQLDVRKHEPDKVPPKVWRLVSVDGLTLPAAVQVSAVSSGTVQKQILFGMLTMNPGKDDDEPGTYRLELQTREITTTAAGVVQSAQPPVATVENGTFTRSEAGDLTLTPTLASPTTTTTVSTTAVATTTVTTTTVAARGAEMVARQGHAEGTEVRLRDPATGYGLIFRRADVLEVSAPSAAAEKTAGN
ncbi:hypothetical protein [Longimicrobium terrae]|uniref:Outer membrane protein beta-barrel domain-containing protein n=1 Tax=Longimicrobium terrae TaxID=1639882 RepID=A0A841H2E6_9BACT|nr:hypothetical protein [Longimicrobium terrae]MBB4637741.1 hypothetical protein [Longimicrobium terrae]MBB6072138.1 hypothetical protein [Longimicrobium terrae]NNC29780.1 hypothetical protein [Longimicrobium terrae]